jgi:hypothetical protein
MTLKEIINDWDPINLFPCAPNDEYNPKIVEIEGLLKNSSEISDISVAIYSVFRKYFGNVFKKSVNDCDYIAKKILQELSNN